MASPHRSTAHSMTPMGGSTLCVGVLDCRPANGKRTHERERPTEDFLPLAIMPVLYALPLLLLSAQPGSAFGPTVEYLAQHNARDDILGKAIPSVQEQLTKDVPEAIQRLEKALAEGKDSKGNPLTAETRAQSESQLASLKSYLEELKQ